MSADLIIKISAPIIAGSVNSAGAIDIPQDGVVENILAWMNPLGLDALSDQCRIELSFGSVNSFDANDARISILEVAVAQNFLTTGGGVSSAPLWMGGINIPVAGGERVHLHTFGSTGVTGTGGAYLYFDARGIAPTRRTRRRR